MVPGIARHMLFSTFHDLEPVRESCRLAPRPDTRTSADHGWAWQVSSLGAPLLKRLEEADFASCFAWSHWCHPFGFLEFRISLPAPLPVYVEDIPERVAGLAAAAMGQKEAPALGSEASTPRRLVRCERRRAPGLREGRSGMKWHEQRFHSRRRDV